MVINVLEKNIFLCTDTYLSHCERHKKQSKNLITKNMSRQTYNIIINGLCD